MVIPSYHTKTTNNTVALVSAVIATANPDRRGFLIYNNSANSAYITYGATSTSSTCTRILATFANFEVLGPTVYVGVISAIRNAGTGNMVVTELL